MTRERIIQLVDFVLEGNREVESDINISLVLSKYHTKFGIWTKEPHEKAENVNYTVYYDSDILDESVRNGVRMVNDPGFVKAEAHYKALMEEVKKDVLDG